MKKYKGGHGGRTLWNKFIEKSFNHLKPNRYLAFINPPGWRAPKSDSTTIIANKLWPMMSNLQMKYLHIYNTDAGKKFFGLKSGTRFDLYVLKK